MFSRGSPLWGAHQRWRSENQALLPSSSRISSKKEGIFLKKNAVFGKSWPTLPEKGKKFLLQFFAFLKKSGIFSNFEFLKQPHYWTILKNT
jgi:hypothetical protein